MNPKPVYLVLCIIGAIVPYVPFVSFLSDHGFDFPLITRELFANRISTGFALDVLLSSATLWILVMIETRRSGLRKLWATIPGNILFGVSFALPFFLYLREDNRPKPRVL